MTDLFPKVAIEYWTDAWQRTILTWDVLRERGNQYIEHEKSGKPPVLAFDYEIVMDGRQLERPANYALARIKPPAGSPPTDPTKRPFVVIDPRAGPPVSYWAGVAGKTPMRYTGGLLGGSWTASFAGDLGHGKFDGAYLVNNFERLDPANTLWTKLYNLYSKVDTERSRFLQFEK